MYLNILKKDLKRKKAMNIILMLFITLAAIFVASSVNNILSVTNALDFFIEKSNMSDYFLNTLSNEESNKLRQLLKDNKDVESYSYEDVYFMAYSKITNNGQKIEGLNTTALIYKAGQSDINYFDSNDNIIKSVPEGTVLISGNTIPNGILNVGDTIIFENGDNPIKLKVGGIIKDVIFGSDMMGNTRFAVNEKDFDRFDKTDSKSVLPGSIFYINGNENLYINDSEFATRMTDFEMLKTAYLMNSIIAGILLVVSVCLILIAFAVLKFTITFTLSEEYREIGVMKAIGIPNIKIRGLYLVKYFSMAIIGALIGFFLSIPFGKLLLSSVTATMVMGNDNMILTNILCCVAVIALIMLFCFGCTRKVKKFTPIDAIRNGATGERYTKKGFLKLHKTGGKPSLFMALNDTLSSPRRFITIIISFTTSLLLVLTLVITADTLRSGSQVTAFGIKPSHLYYNSAEDAIDYIGSQCIEKVEKSLDDIELKLKDNGMDAKCFIEVVTKIPVTYNDKTLSIMAYYGIGVTADNYQCFEGSLPLNANEVMLTGISAEKLGVKIGDNVKITVGGKESEFIVSGLFQSMTNMGDSLRFHHNAPISSEDITGFSIYQIDFKDNPSAEEIDNRKEKLKDILECEDIMNGNEYVEDMVGVAGTIDTVTFLVLIIAMIVIMLVTILMERSFIAKERGEIAILKAIGFRNKSIRHWHTARFLIIGLISSVIAITLTVPVVNIAINPVFGIMGANYGIEYTIDPIKVCLIYPLAVLAVTLISAYLTSIYTKTISACEASGIE